MDDNSFLGQGWGFPPVFLNKGETVTVVSAEDKIRESLQIILSTRLGERIMQPDFGCELSEFVFEEIDQDFVNNLKGIVSDAILNHEPRIKTDKVEVTQDVNEPGLVLISVDYTIRTTNNRYNMVYPFYINEATNPGFLLS